MTRTRTSILPEDISLILSTARTGTKFFEGYINRTCEDMFCAHEPLPSRRFKFLSNLYLQGKLSGETVWREYRRCRRSLWRDLQGRRYVESNNFLFGCVSPIRAAIPRLRIIHIVRHPVDYAVSHMRHGFWRGLKGFTARHVPYWLEALDLTAADRRDPALVLAARWNYVNGIIAGYYGDYLLLRFEDVFRSAAETQCAGLGRLRDFLGCKAVPDEMQLQMLGHKVNPSSNRDGAFDFVEAQKRRIEGLCAPLMERYGYT